MSVDASDLAQTSTSVNLLGILIPVTTAISPLPVIDLAACCTPVTREPMTAESAQQLARTLEAIADPTRLRLLSLVAAHDGGEACVCDLTEPVGLSQPTVSHHLKILVDAGLLTRDKRGVWAYYALLPGALDSVADLISG
jgi:ArsR family transcriptional regulator, arsenate/arsenite/antimonite-responsive transcriptional repressor